VIEQVGEVCLLGQRWNFARTLPGKWCNLYGKLLHCTSPQTEAAVGPQMLRQSFERDLFSFFFAPHKAAITHQKVANLHFEVLKHPDLVPLGYCLFPDLKGRRFLSI
jgi:hypothetical protein